MQLAMQRFLVQRMQSIPEERSRHWQPDYGSHAAYENSISSLRARFRQMIGVVDPRIAARAPEIIASPGEPSELAGGPSFKVFAVRWPVFSPAGEGLCGLHAEGLLLQPLQREWARVVALPDADWTPEMLVGLTADVASAAQFARRLAENGCQVLVPLLINRDDTFSGNPQIAMTNEPHREWIYRMAFEVGRHIIGYEVQKVLAGIDWFTAAGAQVPIGVMGYGEGGLLALYASAVDTRVDVVAVSGYFQERENIWQEPIYRNVWGLLREFGDAEIAGLIAPRKLLIEACRGPEVPGPPAAGGGRKNVACPSGTLTTPPLESVQREFERARAIFAALHVEPSLRCVVNGNGEGPPGCEETLETFLSLLGNGHSLRSSGRAPVYARAALDPQSRMRSQLHQMVAYTQGLVQKAPEQRQKFWSQADASSPQRWRESAAPLRDFLWSEMIGKLPDPTLPPNPRTRMIYDAPRFQGYEVLLDVWPGVFAYGILLVPKDLRPGERRPVVVCEHGFAGRAQEVADPRIDSEYYHHFGASLADLGFVVYAPQDPFVGEERFRILQRLAQPQKLSLYSLILGQHQQLLTWLKLQSFVDAEHIGFYGLSYGGKTAMRVAPLLEGYALCICSGDFNQALWVMTNVTSKTSFMFDDSYDVYEFNFGNLVDYAELASLVAPRPFMVERGHNDGTSTDERVAFEYERVKSFYRRMGISERTTIEYFEGGHTIHGVGTFAFLRQHLQWPGPPV
ncbi:MAG: hypothetical protein JST79_09525 [Acidobacteria bacterium]|nr:hypothetical protein [Acidobacteriota bacterium]